MKTDYCLYILMRTDLPSMGVGRGTAQASHAANSFIHKYGKRGDVKEWQSQTNQGFGTAIVLSVNEDQLNELCDIANERDIPYNFVTDPDYVIRVSKEISCLIDVNKINYQATDETNPSEVLVSKSEVTCGYIFIDRNDVDKIIPELSLLQLYPA